MSTRKLRGAQLKSFRRSVAKLKEKGLVGKRIDARSQKPTRYMQGQVKKFGDVLSGKAKVVSVPKRSMAQGFAEKYRVKGKKIIIPVKTGDTVSFSAKDETIRVKTRTKKGRSYTREIPSANISEETRLGRAKTFDEKFRRAEKRGYMFRIPLGTASWTEEKWDDMVLFMEPYETSKNPYKNWRRYIELIKIEDADE